MACRRVARRGSASDVPHSGQASRVGDSRTTLIMVTSRSVPCRSRPNPPSPRRGGGVQPAQALVGAVSAACSAVQAGVELSVATASHSMPMRATEETAPGLVSRLRWAPPRCRRRRPMAGRRCRAPGLSCTHGAPARTSSTEWATTILAGKRGWCGSGSCSSGSASPGLAVVGRWQVEEAFAVHRLQRGDALERLQMRDVGAVGERVERALAKLDQAQDQAVEAAVVLLLDIQESRCSSGPAPRSRKMVITRTASATCAACPLRRSTSLILMSPDRSGVEGLCPRAVRFSGSGGPHEPERLQLDDFVPAQ